MSSLAQSILTIAQSLPEGGLLSPKECWRRSNIDHLCRLNFDQGTFASRTIAGCG